jgi:IS30 family transposase
MTKTFKHFSIEDRYIISHMRFTEKKKLQDIADKLGRSKSAISMEISRNKAGDQYIPEISNKKYESRLHQKDSCKIELNPAIYDYMLRRLQNDKWSPDVISAMMKRDIGLSVSAETIYNYNAKPFYLEDFINYSKFK